MNENRAQARFALAVLFFINVLNFYDRTILSTVGEPIRKEFLLDDKALGLLNTAFTLIYAFVGIPFGRLADRLSRKTILGVGVAVWSVLTAISGFAASAWQVFAARIGVGVGEASCAPAAASMIADYFPSEKRGKATSIFMLGLPVGIALSFAVSGFMTQNYGWRSAFFVAIIPGVLASALAFIMREPTRGQSTQKTDSSAFFDVLSSPTMRWLILSGAVHNFSLYAVSAFLTSYLVRFHGVEIKNAAYVSTGIYGILTLPGLLAGGAIGDIAKRRAANGGLMVVTFAVLASIPFFIGALQVPAGNVALFFVLIGIAIALLYFYYSIVYATIQDINQPEKRGTAFAVYFMAMYVLGASAGPYVVGMISDHFTRSAAIAAGVSDLSNAALEPFRGAGLHSAMYVVPALSVVLAGIMYMSARSMKGDKATNAS